MIMSENHLTLLSLIHLHCVRGTIKSKMNLEHPKTTVQCALMLAEMSTRKTVQWDDLRFRAYVDIDTDICDDDLPVASEALVFMVVALNSNCKVSIAYYLIAGLSGSELADLVYLSI